VGRRGCVRRAVGRLRGGSGLCLCLLLRECRRVLGAEGGGIGGRLFVLGEGLLMVEGGGWTSLGSVCGSV
jgi:hypothetical protein